MRFSAKWIAFPAMQQVCPVFFTRFTLEKPVKKAVLYASALGLYEPYLNGKPVTENKFMPGWTSYSKRIQYQRMEVTSLLEADNTLALLCGKGWAVGNLGYDGSQQNYGEAVCAIAMLRLEYADGTDRILATDESWRVASSPVRYSDLYNGETVDRTAGFEEVGFAQAAAFAGKLIPQEGEPVREQERLKPARRLITPRGERVVDFGQNLAGYVEVRVQGRRGERIVLRHAETLDADGNFYTDNLRAAKQTVTYILGGDGEEIFKPHFSFQGFRYICLDACPEQAQFTAVAVYSQLHRTGRFVCGHSGVNQLYQNQLWGQKSNFLEVPTDCPQRDERLGWLGDAQVFCQTASLNFQTDRFFRKWLRDVAADQRADGAVFGIAPVVMKKRVTRISAGWGDAAVVCPWVLYQTYADKVVLRRQFNSMRAWVEYIRRFTEGGEALWLGGRQYGDWLALDNGEGTCEGATDKDLIATAYYAHSVSLLVQAGHVLGKTMTEYERLLQAIREAFVKRFLCEGLPVSRTQTACALMLQFDLCTDEKKTADELARLVCENGRRLNTGFLGTPCLLYALSEHGHAGLAYDLLLGEKFPGWLYSVQQGATTMWEHWDGMDENGRLWSSEMNSFNHYAYGAVGEWLYRTVAGIRAESAGFAAIRFCPLPDARLGFVSASLETAHGVVRSSWRLNAGLVRYEFTVPKGTTAQVCLPGGTTQALGAGSYVRYEPYLPPAD